MNLSVILIEIVLLLLGFTVLVFGMLFISPLTFISDYPPEIQAEYYRSQHKEAAKEKLTWLMVLKKLLAVAAFLFLFAWMMHLAGAKTFWQGVGLTWFTCSASSRGILSFSIGCSLPTSSACACRGRSTWTGNIIKSGFTSRCACPSCPLRFWRALSAAR